MMEENCYFVSSLGILKSCDFYSPHLHHGTCYLSKMIQSNDMFDGMSIYVCTHLLSFFVNDILPFIHHKFYLITGNSDTRLPCPDNLSLTTIILSHPKLIKWFAQNCLFTDSIKDKDLSEHYLYPLVEKKIFQLPIGLDYHTIAANPGMFWRDLNEGSSPKEQESILQGIRTTMRPFYQRIPNIFVNLTMRGDRHYAISVMPKNRTNIDNSIQPRTQVWKKMAQFAFVLSPYGEGPDCHRTWEALALGCIPIIRSFGSNQMFQDLPVLIVDNWSQVTPELLDITLLQFRYKHFNFQKLSLQFWLQFT